MRLNRFFKIVVPAIVLTLLVGCRANPIYNVSDSPLYTSGDSLIVVKDVEKAIVSAATSLGWSVKRAGEGKISATLNIRTHRAVADISFTATQFSIQYQDSENLKYNESSGTIHSNYNGWVQRLENAIRSQVGML
ncbi:hypothetical protein ACFL2V_14165 [Pseudomonadota bacterium]